MQSLLLHMLACSCEHVHLTSPHLTSPQAEVALPKAALTQNGLYAKFQVVDAKKASYGVENATYAVVQLAQTTMRSELGKITLDKTFEERATLNLNIVESIRYLYVSVLSRLTTSTTPLTYIKTET